MPTNTAGFYCVFFAANTTNSDNTLLACGPYPDLHFHLTADYTPAIHSSGASGIITHIDNDPSYFVYANTEAEAIALVEKLRGGTRLPRGFQTWRA